MRFGLGILERTIGKIKNCLKATGPDINLVTIQEQRTQTEILGTNSVHFLCDYTIRSPVLARYEQAGGKTAHARLIVDRDQMAAPFLRDLSQAGYTIVTLLKTNQYEGPTSFSEVGEFVPLSFDRKGQVTREVAAACFALPLPDQKDQVLPRPRGPHPGPSSPGFLCASRRRPPGRFELACLVARE